MAVSMKLPISLIILFLSLGAPGCWFLSHYDEVKTLQAFDKNNRQIQEYLDSQEKSFFRLRSDVRHNRLTPGVTKERITSEYGDPVFCRIVEERPGATQECLYRNPTRYFSTDKIYLYFNEAHILIAIEFKPARRD